MPQDIDDSAGCIFYYCHHDPADHRQAYRAWLREAALQGLHIVLVSTYTKSEERYRSNGNELYFRAGPLLRALRVPLYILRRSLKNRCVIIVRRRNPILIAVLALLNKNVKLVLELEGDRESELRYVADASEFGRFRRAAYLAYRWYRCRLEDRFASRVASRVLVVSRTLKSIVESKYGIPEKKVQVFPTGVNTRVIRFDREIRRRARAQLKCRGTVFVYAGNTIKWQMLDRFLRIFEHAFALSSAQAIVILQEEDEDLIERFKRIDENTLFRINVPHEELNKYLNAADIGVVLRENHLLNKAAMPGKCGDYLAAGLRVAMSPHVGDYPEDLEGSDAAILIGDSEDDKVAAGRIMKYASTPYRREEVARWAQQKYGIQGHVKDYVRCIREVAGSVP